ncbi:polysaccharide biosynthesis protein [Staphylococcus massiliensis]|uniref:Uncharacterized protein n=1 Tax=Staphylococcus massiliensis S46 TaxID=1229783 RepID=K9AXA7_9STAP|nr:polysaccharide biosynthesis protein [Staphylococcus massiliensis]EKU46160.1 hypothetical protein C273_09994 [Staphylococcus massiliensis S46]MCG3402801.1 polysaccharide biosynthesis protein [Staphylococcus massiliensis]MCG3413198.1 polysaccharide biosynthesis protein [Staphylococcus massiliensis]POA01949.1 polysaccharide biosynthesis protein [Staphylococcus massiliensis CCUG 55927]
MKTHSAFNGVIILSIALVVVKVLSAIYRIPYQNILGDEGLYAYQQVYPIIAICVVLATNALPSAITQTMGSKQRTQNFNHLFSSFQIIGVIIAIFIFVMAPILAMLMGDAGLTPMIRVSSLAALGVAGLSVCRAYFQMRHRMNEPAISQVIEQLFRVGTILIAILLFTQMSLSIYQAGTIAILASSIGFIFALIYLLWKKDFKLKLDFKHTDIHWKQLLMSALIFALSHLILILWQFIDSFTVINLLKATGVSFEEAIKQKGIFDRGASLIQMGLIVTTTFCFVLIPLLTKAIAERQHTEMNYYANVSLKITIVISVAACVGLMNVLPLLNHVFFKSDVLTLTLTIYMLTVICVSLIMMDFALLQTIEETRFILIAMTIGIITKIILNLVMITTFSILGTSISTVLSLIVFATILHIKVKRRYKLTDMRQFIFKLLVSVAIMTLGVQLLLWLIPSASRGFGLVELCIVALFGVILLVICIGKLRILKDDELQYLPYGDKLARLMKGRHT